MAPASPRDSCALTSDSTPIPERLSIGVAGTVDPSHAPLPWNDAERFVFRQLYETLVRLDCAGQVLPGLAQSWQAADDGRHWTFTLRPGARFSDGTPVTVQAVIDSWNAHVAALPTGAVITAASEGVVEVRVPRGVAARRFADPALAATHALGGQEWPAGTGHYAADTTGGRVTVAPPDGATNRPFIVLRSLGTGDGRDLLDAGIDLLVTDDAAVLSYAAGRSDVVTVGLPWERTYILAIPGEAIPVAAPVRAGLARDAVRIDARPASAPTWWTDPGWASCGLEPPPGAPPMSQGPGSNALLYQVDDATARDLVGRLVALGIGAGGAPRATGLGAAEFTAALASGRAAGYVLTVPAATLEPCAARHMLIGRAPWLADGPERHLTPLIEVRRQAIVRRGAAAFTVDWDGTLRVR